MTVPRDSFRSKLGFVVFLLACFSSAVTAQEPATNLPAHPMALKTGVVPVQTAATPPSDPTKFEVYLLVGQSNMAGRAPVLDEDKMADAHVLILDKEDQWVTQGEPIHFDKPAVAGVGLGYTFGKLEADKKPGVTIGLIPCAFGGTSLDQWNPKSKDTKLYPPDNLYNNAIRRAKIAMQSGTLKGILWHQGESDAGKFASTYASRLTALVAQFRTDLNATSVPFIAGEIGYFNYTAHPMAETINQEIDTLPQMIPRCAVVSAKDLTDKGDHLHFSEPSAKELGKRYFEAFTQLENSPAMPNP